jgi:hypothetical protein
MLTRRLFLASIRSSLWPNCIEYTFPICMTHRAAIGPVNGFIVA